MPDDLRASLNKHQQREERGEWLERFKAICWPDATDSDWLPDNEAAAVTDAYYARIKSGDGLWRVEYETGDPEEPLSVLLGVSETVGDQKAILIVDRIAGSIEAPARALLTSADALWEPSRQDFCVVTRDAVDGLLLEMNPSPHPGSRHDKPVYELRAWGVFSPERRTGT